MDDVREFFQGLFRYDLWPPRWRCGYWSDFHGWIYVISELIIWVAYFLIPLIILNYFLKKKSNIRFRKVYLLFASFILLCGSTHFLDAMMFWIPMYRLNAIVRLATGIVSLFTVYHLFRVLPDLFRQQTNVELEQEIEKRKEAERRLAEANESLQAFAYVASHDLQEPLRKIRTFTGMLYEANKGHFDAQSESYARRVIASSERMQQLISDVLQLSTISNEIELHHVDTTRAVQDALEDLDIRIHERNARIELGILPAIRGNQAFLTQLFFNLISNGLKFNERDPLVRIHGERRGEQVVIVVSDNGIGMEAEDQARIFQPFQRLHSKSKYEGSGIGLSIVKKIVDLHKGTIRVVSRPGQGTSFELSFLPA